MIWNRLNTAIYTAIGVFIGMTFYVEIWPLIQHMLGNLGDLLRWFIDIGFLLLALGLIGFGMITLWKNRSRPLTWSLETTPLILGSGLAVSIGTVLAFAVSWDMLRRILFYQW